MPTSRAAALIALTALSAIASLGGCASYATYPAIPRNTALNDPNTPAMADVMIAGLRYAAIKFPPGGKPDPTKPIEAITEPRFAINLPKGTSPKAYERIVKVVGEGAVALTPETNHLPIYHVTYVRVRGDQAQVNILRAISELPPTPSGLPVQQEIKLQLAGGLRPWHVITARDWDPGLAEMPELNYYAPKGEPVHAKSNYGEPLYKPAPKTADAEPTTQEQ